MAKKQGAKKLKLDTSFNFSLVTKHEPENDSDGQG
jgi:hypothetical protein